MSEFETATEQARHAWQGAAATDDSAQFGYVRPLLAYWWVLTILAVGGGVAGLVYSHLVQPLYRANCRFEVFENQMLRLSDQPNARDSNYYLYNVNPLERQVLLLTSANLDQRVRRELVPQAGAQDLAPGVRLGVRPVEKAPDAMVDLTVDSTDAHYSLKYLKALLAGYDLLRREELATLQEATQRGLRAEQTKLAAELEAAQAELMQFETRHNLSFAEKKSESDLEHMKNILQKSRAIQTQRTILESQFPMLKDANAATLRDVLDLTVYSTAAEQPAADHNVPAAPGWAELPEWRRNEGEVIRLQADYQHLRQLYKPAHPKLKALQDRIDLAKRELEISVNLSMKRLSARRDALRMQEEALETAARNVEAGLDLTAAERAAYGNLKAKVEHLRGLYDKAFVRIIDSSSTPHDVYFSRTVEGPFSGDQPIWPVKWRMVMFGILGGGAGGTALVYLLFFRWVRLYNLDRLEHGLNLPALASVPRIMSRELRASPLKINELRKSDPICEVFRILRSAIDHHVGEDDKVILLTSAEQGDGKTLVCALTALVYAWDKKPVLLVDGDLRKPTLRDVLGFPGDAPGLLDCLGREDLKWQNCVIRGLAPALDVLPGGAGSSHAAELLHKPLAAQIVAEMRDQYSFVIMDSPPVNRVVDGTLLAHLADAVILVVQPGKNTVPEIRYALRRLAGARLLGYVANRVQPQHQWYYADYGTTGYYKSYRDYYGHQPKT